MNLELYIIDNFYSNALDVRNFALTCNFSVQGNYPGYRTGYIGADNVKNEIENNILKRKITYWPEGYNTSFQYTTKDSTTWVHYDETTWAGILYLTPQAPKNTGTSIFRHRQTGYYEHEQHNIINFNSTVNNKDDWEPIVNIENIFNRLILYKGNYYHSSTIAGFGDTLYNARLFQVFFFNSEY